MKVEFHRKFSKDLAKIPKDEVLKKIKDAILHLEGADDLRSLSQIKTLKGGGGFFVKGVRFRIVNSLVVFRCCCESHGCLEHCVTNIRVLFTTSWHAVMAAR